MTPAEKRTASRRTNKAIREAKALERANTCLAFADTVDAAEPAPRRQTKGNEAALLHMLGIVQTMLAECRADLARSAKGDRREIAARPIVDLTHWRRVSA
jgi:hypothetical protein